MIEINQGKSENLNSEKNFRVLLAPNAQLAESLKDVPYSVEAEYWDICIPWKKLTFAHHWSRSNNPAPCEQPNQTCEPWDILVSHIDLDTVWWIMAIEWEKNDSRDEEFWKAAAFIDVNWTHHMHEVPEKEQDKLNAYFAWADKNEKIRYGEITDVTSLVNNYKNAISIVLDDKNPWHAEMISEWKKWDKETTEKIEWKLISESDKIRTFKTDSVFCWAAYYSPTKWKIIPCTLSYNEKFKSITLAFWDKNPKYSACKIMQHIFWPEAWWREWIAGSPRWKEMTMEDLEKVRIYVEKLDFNNNHDNEEILAKC